MGHKLDSRLVNVSCPVVVLRVDLLEGSILQPQVDVPAPESLLGGRRDVGNGALVHLADAGRVGILSVLLLGPVGILLEARKREPRVVVARVVRQLLLVLDSSLAQHRKLDAAAVAVLLLKLGVGGIHWKVSTHPHNKHSQLADLDLGKRASANL